jgi:hypothetical protein
MSARLSASRDGPSKNTRVAATPAHPASARRRAVRRDGRNPANRNVSGGSPDRINAVNAADGPGAAVTGRPSANAPRTSL